jgi:hypothetical protein
MTVGRGVPPFPTRYATPARELCVSFMSLLLETIVISGIRAAKSCWSVAT